MLNNFWIRVHLSYLDDPKFMQLPDETKWHYFAMYLLAKKADAGGLLASNDKTLDSSDIAYILHKDIETINKSISLLLKNKFLFYSDSDIEISNYEEEQQYTQDNELVNKKKEQNRLRVKKHREKIKNIDTKTDKELDKETEKETETEGNALRNALQPLQEDNAEDQEKNSALEPDATSEEEEILPLATQKETATRIKSEYEISLLNHFGLEEFTNSDQRTIFSYFVRNSTKPNATRILDVAMGKENIFAAMNYIRSELV